VRRILERRDTRAFSISRVYDARKAGEKVYNTLTVIGREIGPNERVRTMRRATRRSSPA